MPPPKRTTVGLINRANDCFANANLQALAGCPSLYCYLTQLQYMCPEKHKQALRLCKTLYFFIEQLNEPVLSPKSISPQPLISVIEQIYHSYLSRSQHDAHEMLHLILETLQNEVDVLRRQVPSIGDFVFEGKTQDTIKCRVCGYEKRNNETKFLVLTLAVPQARSTSLQSVLDGFFGTDVIADYNCDKCRVLAFIKAHPESELADFVRQSDEIPEALICDLPPVNSYIEKSTHMHTSPETLAIHLNRSIYSGGAQRNSCKVSIPEQLEVKSGEVTRKFQLCSIVRHSGTHLSGHYECVRRKSREFWRKQSRNFDEEDSGSSLYSPSLESIRSVRSISSMASSETELPFPPPPSTLTSVQNVTHAPPSGTRVAGTRSSLANGANGADGTNSIINPKRAARGPKFWSVSDTIVRECTTETALGAESANYLLFYEKLADKVAQPS